MKIEKVKLGTDITNSTEKALEEIAGNVAKSPELVSHIANASEQSGDGSMIDKQK